MKASNWTKTEIALLKKIYPTATKNELEKCLTGRSFLAIKNKATVLGFKKAIGCGAHKKWSEVEKEILKNLYAETPNSELKKMFQCSDKSLYSAAHLLGLKKSKEYISKISGEVLKIVGINSRFKKGQISHNRGRKQADYMSLEKIEKCAQTQFKKGIKPHNTVSVGYERITKDDYIEIKIGDFEQSEQNFKLKHRIVWEGFHGEVPPGYQVRFKDCNKRNFDIDNLELVSFSDSLKINSMCDSSIAKRFLGIKQDDAIAKFKPIIDLKRNIIKLNQKIKQHGKEN
jgi:hypothetical protein